MLNPSFSKSSEPRQSEVISIDEAGAFKNTRARYFKDQASGSKYIALRGIKQDKICGRVRSLSLDSVVVVGGSRAPHVRLPVVVGASEVLSVEPMDEF